jgi:dTDP-4-dehydrorhamnose 3,5-epimerase
VRWDDPEIGIRWPLDGVPELSQKDREAPLLAEVPPERLPTIEDYP